MIASKSSGMLKKFGFFGLYAAAALLAGCATGPVVRTQTAVGANLVGAHTFAYLHRLGTDSGPYRSLTSQWLERDVTQQMQARGYTLVKKGQKPDLLVDFHISTHNRIEGDFAPMFSAGYWGGPWGWGWGPGWGGPYGPGWGWGGYYNDVRTVTRADLTVTVIDAQDRMALWSGTTASELTSGMMSHPNQALDRAVRQIFAHYPVHPAS